MNLTNEHIKDLYCFTQKHFVSYYDVQTELVDHLANDIEQILEKKPMLTFEEARDISFKKFGVFGFMSIVEEKENQLHKKYWKIILNHIKNWFKIPNMACTILIFLFFYKIVTVGVSSNYFMGIWCVFIVYISFKLYQLKKEIKQRKTNTKKTWLLEHFIYRQGAVNVVLIPFYSFQFIIQEELALHMEWYYAILTALISTLMVITSYISLYILPKKIEKILTSYYTEYKHV